jgi:branched-chain amino acid transport system permease protein
VSETTLGRLQGVALAAIVLICLLAPIFGTRLIIYNLTIIALYATVVISLNLLLGIAGQASFAQTTFMAIGGYGLAIMTKQLGLNPWLSIALSLGISILVAAVIGMPLLRLRGHYLSMGTIALALGTYSFANASSITNGGWGISGVPTLYIGTMSFRNPLNFYILAWVICFVSLAAFYLLANSHIGRAWRTLSTRADIAATLGIDVPRYKLMVLVIAASMASLAGSFYVAYTHFVGPDLYDISIVINLILMLYVGGTRSVVGPIVGAAFVIMVPQMAAGLERYQNVFFYVLLLLVILVKPSGLFGKATETRGLDSMIPLWLLSRLRARSR